MQADACGSIRCIFPENIRERPAPPPGAHATEEYGWSRHSGDKTGLREIRPLPPRAPAACWWRQARGRPPGYRAFRPGEKIRGPAARAEVWPAARDAFH